MLSIPSNSLSNILKKQRIYNLTDWMISKSFSWVHSDTCLNIYLKKVHVLKNSHFYFKQNSVDQINSKCILCKINFQRKIVFGSWSSFEIAHLVHKRGQYCIHSMVSISLILTITLIIISNVSIQEGNSKSSWKNVIKKWHF